LGDLRALESVFCKGVTDDVLGGTLLESLDELVVDAFLNVDTATGTAALSVVEEDTEVDPRNGIVDVCIVKDNVWRLATKLKGDLLQVGASSGLHDLATDNGGASEGNLVNVHVSGNGGTSSLAKSRNDINDTWWEASLLDELGSVETRQWGLLSGLENDSVTASNGGTDLPGPHEEGKVPWNDLTANTNLLN